MWCLQPQQPSSHTVGPANVWTMCQVLTMRCRNGLNSPYITRLGRGVTSTIPLSAPNGLTAAGSYHEHQLRCCGFANTCILVHHGADVLMNWGPVKQIQRGSNTARLELYKLFQSHFTLFLTARVWIISFIMKRNSAAQLCYRTSSHGGVCFSL